MCNTVPGLTTLLVKKNLCRSYLIVCCLVSFVTVCSIVRRLEVTPENIVQSFTNVVEEMFADGQYNWGRIVTVYAFAGWLVRYCCCGKACDGCGSSLSKTSCRHPDSAKQMAVCAGDYVARRLSTWVQKQGGWVSYISFITCFQ